MRTCGTFVTNVNEFHEKGFISLAEKQILRSTLDVGHAAIQRKFRPCDDDTSTIVDIAEHLVQQIYVFPEKAQRLDDNVPKRKR